MSNVQVTAGLPFVPLSKTVTVVPTNQGTGWADLIKTNIANTGTIRLVNSGPDVAFFKFSQGQGPLANFTDIPVLPNMIEYFFIRNYETHISTYCVNAFNTIYATYGVSE